MRETPTFSDLASVEAWDAWFRWRQGRELHDLSIQETWWRVAHSLASVERANRADECARRLILAFRDWRLLLDESLLATAGTDQPRWESDGLVAVLNLAAFVDNPGLPHASIDLKAIEATAALAVRALDNALILAGGGPPFAGFTLRVGVMGLANALARARLPYDSAQARRCAHDMARCLSVGCLRGSMHLLRERGARCAFDARVPLAYRLRHVSALLRRHAERHGFRHTQLTAITSQPRLALLANGVANAVDPMTSSPHASSLHPRVNGDMPRQARDSNMGASIQAQLAMRSAMQMWIDQPILYPMQPPASEPQDALA